MKRQIGFVLSFFISVITTPIIGLIITALSPYKNDGNQNVSSINSTADELQKLHELKEKGVITNDEFNQQKKKILSL